VTGDARCRTLEALKRVKKTPPLRSRRFKFQGIHQKQEAGKRRVRAEHHVYLSISKPIRARLRAKFGWFSRGVKSPSHLVSLAAPRGRQQKVSHITGRYIEESAKEITRTVSCNSFFTLPCWLSPVYIALAKILRHSFEGQERSYYLPPHVGPVRNWKEIQDTSDLRPSKRIPVLRPLYRTGSLCLVM
jgi:hypothetical protein